MDGPRRGRLRRTIAVAAFLASVTLLLVGSAAGQATPPTLRVLQFNLCNSGIAECYTGRSVARAAEVIRANAPDVVTINEACRGDLDQLRQAFPDDRVASAFKAAGDRRTGGDFRCRNGQAFGIGVLVRLPAAAQASVPYRG